jgi:hypothetical protein
MWGNGPTPSIKISVEQLIDAADIMTRQYSGSFSMTLDMHGKTSCLRDRSGTFTELKQVCPV